MRNNKKGITVTSITVYIILFFMFTTITTIISSSFNEDLFKDRGTAINITAINKLEYNLLKSADESDNIKGNVQGNKTILTFSNSDVYTFDGDKNIIYKNGGKLVGFVKDFEIKLIDNILDMDITLNKYTNEVSRNIKINCPANIEYVSSGIVAHFDGINNVGNGTHDATSSIWKDISNNAVVGNLASTFKHDGITNGWVENGLLFSKGSSPYDSVSAVYTLGTYPAMTVEITIRTIEQLGNSGNSYVTPLYIFDSAKTYMQFSARRDVRLMYGVGNNTIFDDSANSDYYMNKDGCYTLTFVQNDLTTRTYYFNGEKRIERKNLTLNEIELRTIEMRGSAIADYVIHSLRVYDRALTDKEVQDNFSVDRLRFGK